MWKKPIFIAQINEKRLKHDRNGQQSEKYSKINYDKIKNLKS